MFFWIVGSSSVQVFSLNVLVKESVVLVVVFEIFEGVSALNVSGQLISVALFLVNHLLVRLSVRHLLAHFVLMMFLIVVFTGQLICVAFHFRVIICVFSSFSSITIV